MEFGRGWRRVARRGGVGARATVVFLIAIGPWLASCKPESQAEGKVTASGAAATGRPNVLWVVWDTARSDRMSLYGYAKPTTPKLESWAKGARVYENCVSTAGSTVPSHASMFTGLLPSEHATNNDHQMLSEGYTTIAELMKSAGYSTYLFAANPHISSDENFAQGFDVEEHPWSPKYKREALGIVQGKVMPQDRTSELSRRIRNASKPNAWDIKAAGELAQKGLLEWLSQRDGSKPYFAFLNYMEAHRPFLPPEKYRRLMMTPEQVERSYLVDRSWTTMWAYTFGLHTYSEEDIEVMAATYDATLAELDELFAALLEALEGGGHLKDTIIILTADHGEHLGEHHMMDHQFGLYQPILNVPLVLYYPPRVAAGREADPVMNFDLFPTLLELCGLAAPTECTRKARSLLKTAPDRVRLAEYPAVFNKPIRDVRRSHAEFDATPWQRTLRAVFDGPEKYIWGSDGQHELFDLGFDPGELTNLMGVRTESRDRLEASLAERVAELCKPLARGQAAGRPKTQEERDRLEGLGYGGGDDDEERADDP